MSLLRQSGLSSRRASSIVEALTAMLLMIAVMGAALRTLAAFRVTLAGLTGGAELRETARVVRYSLSQETGWSLPQADWITSTGDSIALRAFRGTGVVCASAPPPAIAVQYNGLRRPDTSKDSVLALDGDGVWRVADLVRARSRPGACGRGVAGELWELDPAVPGAVVARVFERGSYHIAAGALRYRRGRGGRQPLTAQVLRTEEADGSGILPVGAGFDLRLIFDHDRSTAFVDSMRVWPREVWP